MFINVRWSRHVWFLELERIAMVAKRPVAWSLEAQLRQLESWLDGRDTTKKRKKVEMAIDDHREDDEWPWAAEDELAWRKLNTWECLKAIGSRMAEHSLVLACVDIRSDSYPLILLRSRDFGMAEGLARESQYGEIMAAADLR
jgi:hypothetical protein